MNRGFFLVLIVLSACISSCKSSSTQFPDDPKLMTIKLSSSTIKEGLPIPTEHTCDGADSSPDLSWSGVPKEAKSLIVVCEDPDASFGTWVHWLVYYIAPDRVGLPARLPAEEIVQLTGETKPFLQGRNDFGKRGWGGPCPPSGTHHYVFRIVALDFVPELVPGRTKDDLAGAAAGHVIAFGKLTALYSHQ